MACEDGIINVQDIDDVPFEENATIDFLLNETNRLDFTYQVLVPEAAGLLLAVQVPFDLKERVVWIASFQGDPIGNVHEHLLFYRGLWISEDKVDLRCVPIVHRG